MDHQPLMRHAANREGDVLALQRTNPVGATKLVLLMFKLYLVGYCHLRRAIRVFAMERIRGLDVLSRRFTLPAGFDPEKYLAGALGVISGDLVTVKVVFAKKLARYIRERLWYPSQKFRDLTDGRLELTLRVADTLEVRRWILGYDVQAEVIEPAGAEADPRDEPAVARRVPRATTRVSSRPRRA